MPQDTAFLQPECRFVERTDPPRIAVILNNVYNMQMVVTRYPFGNPLHDRKSSPEVIVESLRQAIIEGHLGPGELLRQENLAQHFSVSRIPVREALRQLESEGWIEVHRNRGARVSSLGADEVREIYEIRALLETAALRLAAPRHDAHSIDRLLAILREAHNEADPSRYVDYNRKFHVALYAPAQRQRLAAMIEALHAQGERYLRLKLATPALKQQSDDEHVQIVEAVRAGDIEQAVRVLQPHLLQTGEMLAEYVTNHQLGAAAATAPRRRTRG
jgi:DNA-binding GntR family transcriptional regulator